MATNAAFTTRHLQEPRGVGQARVWLRAEVKQSVSALSMGSSAIKQGAQERLERGSKAHTRRARG